MKIWNKNYIRKSMLSFFDHAPGFLANPLARFMVYVQHRAFIKELRNLSAIFPCRRTNFRTWKRILVIRLDSIGDITWTTAFFRELRADFPDAEIDVILRPVAKVMMEHCPYVDRIYTYDCVIGRDDDPNEFSLLREKARGFIEAIVMKPEEGYDAVFLPREIFLGEGLEALYLAAYSKTPVRIGRYYATNALEKVRCSHIAPFFSFFSRMQKPKHQAAQILDELRLFSAREYREDMELWLSDEEHRYFHQWQKKYRKPPNARLVIVGLEGSSQNRSWALENYEKVFAEEIKRCPREIFFVLLADREISQEAKERLDSLGNVVDMSGRTKLREAVALIAHSDLYLGSDTGLMHIAAAFGKPIVELAAHFRDGRVMDSGSPVLVGPWKVANIVLEPETGLDDCVGWCTKSYPHCINQIQPETVSNALCELLKYEVYGEEEWLN